MKNHRVVATLFALALFVGMAITPLSTLAQFAVGEPNSFHQILQGQPISLISRADSTARLLSGDASGNLYVREISPSANNFLLMPSVISGIFVPVNDGQTTVGTFENRDSTSVIDCRGYNRAALLVLPSVTNTTDAGAGSLDSLGAQVLAMEVRAHYSTISDSLSTFIWREDTRSLGGWSALPAIPPAKDTLGGLNDAVSWHNESGRATGIRTRVLPGERAVVVSGFNNNNGTAAGEGTGENRGRVIFVNKPAASGGIGLPPFMSIRFRSVASYRQILGTTSGLVLNDSTTDAPMRLRADLLLWRE